MKSRLVILIFAAVSFYITCNMHRNWTWWVFKSDKSGYHLYLPALFIFNDLAKLEFYGYIDAGYAPTGEHKEYELNPLEGGNKANKYPIGVAVHETPFFLAAHAFTLMYGFFPPDGYSKPYEWGAIISNLFWAVCGLFAARSLLRRYFSDTVTAITLLAIAFGTNLYYYVVFSPGMAHAYLFFDLALVMLFTERLFSTCRAKYFYLLGLALGLTAITRPADLVVGVVPLLWGLTSIKAVKQRFSFLLGNLRHVAGACFVFACIAALQIAYWKYVTNEWIYDGYIDEGFIWTAPAIIEGLFGFRKGWFIYTPLAVFAVWGIYSMRKRFARYIPAIAVFMVVNIYIIFCWWNWWYGGGFGARPLTESWAILSLPLATFIQQVTENRHRILKYLAGAVLILLCALNMFQSYQANKNVIHWDGMTREYYFRVFLKVHPKEEDKALLLSDEEKMLETARRMDQLKK